MAVYGVIADVHGNKEALIEVIRFLEGRCVDAIVCLGDIVGFNADPNECVDIIRSRAIESVAGNHDLISINRLGFEGCANKVTWSLKQTRRDLTAESVAFLGTLEARMVHEEKFLVVHGSLLDVQQYVTTTQEVRENAQYLKAMYPGVDICFFGHTHEQRFFELANSSIMECGTNSIIQLREGRTYFINPGSVDASRKRNHKLAECGIFDSGQGTLAFHRLPYDHEAAERKAQANGYRIGRVAAWLDHFRNTVTRSGVGKLTGKRHGA